MQATSSTRQTGGLILLGGALVIVGLGTIALRAAGFDPIEGIAEAGWPLFVIVPGLGLLLAALVPAPPHGIGFAIGGAIVTTVGLILAYQNATGHWESWAYIWALIPCAAGLALLVYGLLYRQREMASQGMRMAAVAAVLLTLGFWFFESLFESGRVPADLQNLWPVVVIGLGIVTVVISLVGKFRGGPGPTIRAAVDAPEDNAMKGDLA